MSPLRPVIAHLYEDAFYYAGTVNACHWTSKSPDPHPIMTTVFADCPKSCSSVFVTTSTRDGLHTF